MKSEAGRTKKQRKAEGTRASKPPCGTLSYLAECRGNTQKTDSSRWTTPPDGLNRIVRKHPVDK
ncbi:MAG TPA: hypothetical protein VFG02_10475 [Nitrospirota bacterium]|nr:hypothetical protein [Nitrospirota bacterium]